MAKDYILLFLFLLCGIACGVTVIYLLKRLFPSKAIDKDFFKFLEYHAKKCENGVNTVKAFLDKFPEMFYCHEYYSYLDSVLSDIHGAPTIKWVNYKHHNINTLGKHGTEVYVNKDAQDAAVITRLYVGKFKFEKMFWEAISDTPECIPFLKSMPDLFCFSGESDKPHWATSTPHKLDILGLPLYVYVNEFDIIGLSSIYIGLFISDKNRLPKELHQYIDTVIYLHKKMTA